MEELEAEVIQVEHLVPQVHREHQEQVVLRAQVAHQELQDQVVLQVTKVLQELQELQELQDQVELQVTKVLQELQELQDPQEHRVQVEKHILFKSKVVEVV